jgi:hypothetical protein
MNTITLNIRYRAHTPNYTFKVNTDKDSMTIDEIADKLSKEIALKYSNYMRISPDCKEIRRYQLGQKKLIEGYLEKKL